MELVVYIAIMGIIVIVAGQAFSNSTKFRVRNQSMIEANEVAGNIAALIKDDVAQMGAKSAKEETATGVKNDSISPVFSDIYIDPENADNSKKDSSSFKISNNNDLKFRRLRYDGDGHYQAIEEVRWYLDGEKLMRSCWTVSKQTGFTIAADDPCVKTTANEAIAVEIAEGVSSFNIEAGQPKVKEEDEQLFPPSGNEFMLVPRFGEAYYNLLNVENNGNNTVLTGFALNYNKSENTQSEAFEHPEQAEKNQLYVAENEGDASGFGVGSWKNACSKSQNNFSFDSNVVYEISFNLLPPTAGNKMEMFNPGRDFLSVGFRDKKGDAIPQVEDFLFYPPTGQNATAIARSMRFSVKNPVKEVCLAFTFASFSPVTAEGMLTIENVKLKKVASANYEFSGWNTESSANIVEKKNVKAFQATISIKRNGEEGRAEEIIRTPANGPRD